MPSFAAIRETFLQWLYVWRESHPLISETCHKPATPHSASIYWLYMSCNVCTHLCIYIYMTTNYIWRFAQQWVIPFEFCIPQNSHFTGGRDDKPLDFGVPNFERKDGTQHLAQIQSKCADCTHASMCDPTGSAFSWAPHSFWRLCHLLQSKHSRQSKVSDPFAARWENQFRFWCRPRHETERYPISEAMATVELHNRSADVASPGCLAGLSEDSHRNNNHLFASSVSGVPGTVFREVQEVPAPPMYAPPLRGSNDPVPRRTRFPGWFSP